MRNVIWSLGIIIGFIVGGIFLPSLIDAGSLEPTAPPGPTMKTLDEIPPTWSQKLPSSERFVLVLNGEAVLDKETGLVWEQSPNTNYEGIINTWIQAFEYCVNLEVSDRKGWRLPTIDELSSLIDCSNSNPALPAGHPFNIVFNCPYGDPSKPCIWWSTSQAFSTDISWHFGVDFRTGEVSSRDDYYIPPWNHNAWCVRGGTHR